MKRHIHHDHVMPQDKWMLEFNGKDRKIQYCSILKKFLKFFLLQKVHGERLMFTLEPEAVSVYYQYLHDYQPTDVPQLDRRYVVVDMGGIIFFSCFNSSNYLKK